MAMQSPAVAGRVSKAAHGTAHRRIFLVCNDIGRGGAEIQLVDIALQLVARGHQVTVCALMSFLDFEEKLNEAGIQTCAVGMKRGTVRPWDLARLARLIRQHRPDVVHAHLFGASIVSRLARILAPGPAVVCTLHMPYASKPFRYQLLRATDALAVATTNVCTPGVRNFVAGKAIPRRKAHYTPNGIDVDAFLASVVETRGELRQRYNAGNRFIWFTAGSFRDEQKDYGNLLHAFRQVVQQTSSGPSAELWIAGDGVLRVEKERLARELGLDDCVRFLGLRSDVAALMKAADAFVLASAFEAHPITLLEAAAMGLPAVSTDAGGASDIVKHGATGFLVPTKSPEALGQEMVKLMQRDPADLDRIRERARVATRDQFNIDVVVRRWEDLYSDLLG